MMDIVLELLASDTTKLLVSVVIVPLLILVTLIAVIVQTKRLRKQMRGEVYSEAKIQDLAFFLPEKQKHEIEGFKQQNDKETYFGKYIAIPVGLERELHVRYVLSQSQTLRSYNIGFKGSNETKPIIIGAIHPFAKKIFQEFIREEYIDWHGYFHCEYTHHRRFAKNDCMVIAIKVKGLEEGIYPLHVTITVDDAPKSWEDELIVECLKQSSDWTLNYWEEAYNN